MRMPCPVFPISCAVAVPGFNLSGDELEECQENDTDLAIIRNGCNGVSALPWTGFRRLATQRRGQFSSLEMVGSLFCVRCLKSLESSTAY